MKAEKCIVLFLLIALLAGCGTSSSERVELYRQAADKLSEASAQLDKQLLAIETVLQESRKAFSDPNITSELSEQLVKAIDQALAKKAEIEPVKAKVDVALAQIKTKLSEIEAGGEVDLSKELDTSGTALVSSGTAVGGQYGPILISIGMLLPIIAAAIKSLKKARVSQKNAEDSQRITDKVIASVDTLLSSALVTDKEQAKELLKKDQGETISAAVKAIKNG